MTTHSNTQRLLAFTISMFLLGGCLSGGGDSSFTGDDGNTGATGNRPPEISGNPPAAVRVGEPYIFTPSALDPDGDPLTFSVANKPNWLSFDPGSGALSGTPSLANVGTFANIQLSVSDGQARVELATFSIDVTQVATASTTLSWNAPTLNEDGTSLTDLSGYKIYFGKSSGNYTNTIQIDNPGITTYVIENLSPGTYFFAATAFNATGSESRFSGEAVTTLN